MRKINSRNFKRYGWVIEGPAKNPKINKQSENKCLLHPELGTG
jgi:hypothetical protein